MDLVCDFCGASVKEEATELHLKWHKDIDDAFGGVVMVVHELNSKIERLSSQG